MTEEKIAWPAWVDRQRQIGFEAVLRYGKACASDSPMDRRTAFRDVVRSFGFNDRNSVGVLSDLVETKST